MRILALVAGLAAIVSTVSSAHAVLPNSFLSACAEKSTIGWCPKGASREGWTLKYQAESPKDLADAYWRYEVWTREKLAVVCVLSGGRGGVRMNACQELSEVQ